MTMRSIFLTSVLLLIWQPMTARAELQVQTLPETGDMYGMLDLSDPYRTTISGLFRQPIETEAGARDIHVYIGAENRQSEPFVMVLVDKETNVGTFLETSGWQRLADEQGLIVAAVTPPGEAWQDGDTAFLDEVYAQTHDRSHYNAQKGNNYLLAYGDAARIGQIWAMESPQNFASFATFGDFGDIPVERVADAAAQPTKLEGVTVGDLPMPVWFFVSELDQSGQEVLDQWNSRNNAMPEKLSSDLADGIFLARQNTTDSLIDEQNSIAQTRYSTDENPVAVDPERTQAVWTFLSSYIRPVGFANNSLRAARTLEEWGATKRELQVGDVTRYYVEYVPDRLSPTRDGKAPLVVYMHGDNNTAESMLARSEFIKVARERGFITILLTGALYHNDTMFPNPKWNLMESEDEFDDYAYVRAAVEDAMARLPVDTTRIYAMGQSYGSMASIAMSLRMNDIFAATATTGAFLLDDVSRMGDMTTLYTSDKVLEGNMMPLHVLLGEHDKIGEGDLGGVWENRRMQEQMPYWLTRNGLEDTVDAALTGTYKSGRFNVYEFASDEGVPLVQYSTVDDRIHTIVASDLYFQYDTFVSKWSREEDGTLRYMGQPVARNEN